MNFANAVTLLVSTLVAGGLAIPSHAQNSSPPTCSQDANSTIRPCPPSAAHPRARLNIKLVSVTGVWAEALNVPEFRGEFVAYVESGGPGAKAGLMQGDIIVGWDGSPIINGLSVYQNLLPHLPGDRVRLTIDRLGQTLVLDATLGPEESNGEHALDPESEVVPTSEANAHPLLDAASGTVWQDVLGGTGFAMLPKYARQLGDLREETKGVIVAQIAPSGPLARSGIERGDIILSVNFVPINSTKQLDSELLALPPNRKAVLLRIQRRKQIPVFVAVPIMAKK